ncbi:MAG: RNA polymerase factor sigma-54 [Treponema sp.]|nr:RNA polymerase factor sigma-54 [Treponema sp.]
MQLIQKQQFKLSSRLYQSVNILRIPLVELREKITEELERNPALELIEDPSMASLDEIRQKKDNDDDDFGSTSVSDAPFISGGGSKAADEHQQFIEGVLARPESLQDHLLWQLRLQPIDEQTRRIGELLIQNLNEDGFHREPVKLLFKNGEDTGQIRETMKLIQSFDPVGTCVADYQESLRVQVGLIHNAPAGMLDALAYLELLQRGKIAEVAKKLHQTEDELEEIFEWLKELSPFPGRQFAGDSVRYVVPDVRVTKRDDERIIVVNNEEIPVLGIDPFFKSLAQEQVEDKEVRDFARESIKEAREFIEFVHKRGQTLRKIVRSLVRFQTVFFERGPKYLRPLVLTEIADDLGLDESTISRAVRDKYLQTEWGVFELRYFFTNSISTVGVDKSHYSRIGVKEILKEIIEREQRHFSDQELVGMLAMRGIHVARRTVAKYRRELDFGSSYAR